MNEFEGFLSELPGKISRKNIAAIMEYVEGMDREDDVNVVEVNGARVLYTHVNAYGLVIGLDSSERAVSVRFPYGGTVTE